MPRGSDAALALADQLRSLSDPELAGLLEARAVPTTGIRDFFDLADVLLEPESMQSALGRLQRPALAALATIGELGAVSVADLSARLTTQGTDAAGLESHLAEARALGLLLERDGLLSVPPPVIRHLEAWPERGMPSLAELASQPAPATLSPVGMADPALRDRVASERAFATTSSVAELVASLQTDPARELARGGIALPDSRRLAASTGVDLDRVPELVEMAERAGLVQRGGGETVVTDRAVAWLPGGSGDRWAALAQAWVERLPGDVRAILRDRAGAEWGDRLVEYLHWLYPAGGDWMRERLTVYVRDAESLGITHESVPSGPGTALLIDGADAARAAMTALFPVEVDRVYLQHDLSVVAPGPLEPRIDARLRTMAEPESVGLASSYRVTTASLNRAMATGETAATVRTFLGGISLTGIPQPLEYLIAEAADRLGLVRVGSTGEGGAYVRSSDAGLLRTLLVDQSLAPLGLSRSAERLVSRFDRGVVFWSLAEARYPVAAENADGQIVPLDRPRRGRPAAVIPPDPRRALIEKLRLGSPGDAAATDRAWLERQLDVAIRGKLALTVTVTMPDGTSVAYQLEPASVAAGRLRARDRRTDLERTLPLSSITSVGPAES